MRILLINQFFWPDAAATSQYLTDLACFLSSQGHQVEVICGKSSYAQVDEAGPRPEVNFHHVACASFTSGLAGRVWSYVSFFAGAFWKALRAPSPDIILTLTTPPMLPVLGTALKKLRSGRHFIWEMDLFPEALSDVGLVSKGSPMVRVLGSIADWSRSHSDGIIALGDCMRRRLVERGVDASKIHVAENWADGKSISPPPARLNGPVTLLYSGNLGRSHDVDTILWAMENLKSDPQFQFRFAGGGPRRGELAAACLRKEIATVSFAPYCRRDVLARNLAEGDIGLVTQRPSCLGTVVPSKIYGLMAAGRPILYIGPKESTCATIISRFRCGWQVDCGDGPAVVDLLKKLAAQRELLVEAGIRGREAFLEHYDLPQGVARISEIITGPVYGTPRLADRNLGLKDAVDPAN